MYLQDGKKERRLICPVLDLDRRKNEKPVNVKTEEIKAKPLTQKKPKGLEASEEAQSPSRTSAPNPFSTKPKPPGWR